MLTIGQRVHHPTLGGGVLREIGEQYGALAGLVQWYSYARTRDSHSEDYWNGKTKPRTWVRLASLIDPGAPVDPGSFRDIAHRIASGPEDEDFIYAILGHPYNEGYQALLDRYFAWLRAQGDPRGEYVTVLEKLRPGSMVEGDADLSRRRDELRSQIGQLWPGLILREPITGIVTGMDDHAFYVEFDGLESEVFIGDMSS
jgi:hypothetical protein